MSLVIKHFVHLLRFCKSFVHWVQTDPAVYELKWSFVQEHGLYIETAVSLTTLGPNTISETFQMRYYIKVSFKR